MSSMNQKHQPPSSNQSQAREVTLKQLEEQKQFVQEYCKQFELENRQQQENMMLQQQQYPQSDPGAEGSNHDLNSDQQLQNQQHDENNNNEDDHNEGEEAKSSENRLISQRQMDEMESVLYSISFGTPSTFKKVKYQAFSAAISHQNHVDLVINYISRRGGINQAKTSVIAYRVGSEQEDENEQYDQQQNNYQNVTNPDQQVQSFITEGYDDGNEEGCGQKLLGLLQKMGVENILIVVYVWHQRMPGQFTAEIYKMVVDRAKDLLTTLHVKVMEAERILQERLNQYQIEQRQEAIKSQGAVKGNNQVLAITNGAPVLQSRSRLSNQPKKQGNDLITKVYPSDIIPDRRFEVKRDYRPNNFMNSEAVMRSHVSIPGNASGSALANGYNRGEDYEEEELEIELTEQEFQYAVEMTESSIRRLTKAHIIDLRNLIKPHYLVEKVLNMVCILKGCIAPNWTMAREMLSSMTFKLELMLMDVCQIKPSLIKRVIKTLNNFHKQMTPENLSQFSEGASILLTWIINLIKWNAGHNRYKYRSDQFHQSQANDDVNQQEVMIHQNNDEHLIDEDEQRELNQFTGHANTHQDTVQTIMQSKNMHQQQHQRDIDQEDMVHRPAKYTTKEKALQNQFKNGQFVKSKQMIFGKDKKLQPLGNMQNKEIKSHHSNMMMQLPETSNYSMSKKGMGGNATSSQLSIQNQLVRQYQDQPSQELLDAAQIVQQEKNSLKKIIGVIEADSSSAVLDEIKQSLPENEEEIIRYLDQTSLEEQPTDVLVQLAERLKERRTKLYPEEMLMDEDESMFRGEQQPDKKSVEDAN